MGLGSVRSGCRLGYGGLGKDRDGVSKVLVPGSGEPEC